MYGVFAILVYFFFAAGFASLALIPLLMLYYLVFVAIPKLFGVKNFASRNVKVKFFIYSTLLVFYLLVAITLFFNFISASTVW